MEHRNFVVASSTALLFLTAAVATPTPSPDWPQWHGPRRDNLSADTGLLQSWPPSGPPLVWKATGSGSGYSSISIASGRIFTMGDIADASYLIAVSLDRGMPLWKTKVGAAGGGGGIPSPRCSPAVGGDLVFALNQHGDLICANCSDGGELWRKSMTKDFGGSVGGWGYSESPLIDGEKLICTPGGRAGTVIALDKKTGEPIWRSQELSDAACYASLIIAEIGGVRQYIMLTDAHVAGIAAGDGAVLWQAERIGQTAVCTTPICKGDLVFVTSAYDVGCNCFRITRSGDKFSATQLYANKDMKNHHGGVVIVGDYLYGCSENGGLRCMELATGKVRWTNPGGGGGGSLTYADGHLIHRDEFGTVALVVATPEGYKPAGHFKQSDRSNQSAWPHPVVAGGKLYLRDQDVLLCYDLKAK